MKKIPFTTWVKITILFSIIFNTLFLNAQSDTIKYDVTLSSAVSNGTYAPFWLQSNRYGVVSSTPQSAYLSTKICKDYGNNQRNFDYGFIANLLMKTDNQKKELYFHELYAKGKAYIFDLSVGFKEEIFGNQDSTLSTGGFLYSSNTQPIPKIFVGIEHFTPVPNTKDIEIKGGISHGWFRDDVYIKNMLYHHKYVNLRVKATDYRLWFEFGLDHSAQWGGILPGDIKQSTTFTDFMTIFFGRGGGKESAQSERINALGNHLVSQSLKIQGFVGDYEINGYWQNISEDGPIILIWNSMNVRDGLWGLSVKNDKFPIVKKFLYEYLSATDQSGPYHDKDGIIYGGSDSYFTNGIYLSGWTHFGRTIGTPLITSPLYNTDGYIGVRNNRVRAHHFGIEGNVESYNYRLLSTFSENYGLYNGRYKPMKPNTSLLLEVNKKFTKLWNLEGKLSLAADFGTLFGNSVGSMFSIRKTGDIFKY